MVCRVADNPPLKALRAFIGAEESCHSFRGDCLHRLNPAANDRALGASGAIFGYCQALFARIGTPAENTIRVQRLLQAIDAPWAFSHELFWGHKGEMGVQDFVSSAVEPLTGLGRVPILITSLTPTANVDELREICGVTPPVAENEPILFRTVAATRDDLLRFAEMIDGMVASALRARVMPKWWPLIQTSCDESDWLWFRDRLGSNYRFVNTAINPFQQPRMIELMRDQVTVMQVPIGEASDILSSGCVDLNDHVPIFGKGSAKGYDAAEFLSELDKFDAAPTLIVLGPTLPEWTDADNQRRVAAILPFIRSACLEAWHGISFERKREILAMVA